MDGEMTGRRNETRSVFKLETKRALEQAALLFAGWEETMIWSCLQNVMGSVFATCEENSSGGAISQAEEGSADLTAAMPVSAMAVLGDFAFLAGAPDERLAAFKPDGCEQEFIIMVPQHEGWIPLIEACYGDGAKRVMRYGTKKNPAAFDSARREMLRKMAVRLPEGSELRLIDEELYHVCKSQLWSKDLVSQYETYASFQNLGLGVCVLCGGELAAGASSYSSFRGGIEIEIDTREDFRRHGLAAACGARLILECLEKGLYPSWDAQNPESLALAEKLGYESAGSYIAYEIWNY